MKIPGQFSTEINTHYNDCADLAILLDLTSQVLKHARSIRQVWISIWAKTLRFFEMNV